MFDVDCPRTPDGGDDDANKKNGAPVPPGGVGRRPPRSTSATPRGGVRKGGPTAATPRGGASRKSVFSPRGPSNRKSAGGMDPEEYIAPPPRPPGSGGMARAPGSGGPAGGYRSAPGSGNAGGDGGDRRCVLSEALGTNNPFDSDDSNGDDGGDGGGNRARTDSGNWWREEIVEEGHDKGEAMEKYYGLKPGEKQELYGAPTHAAANATANANANAAARGVGRNPFDEEQGGTTVQQGMRAQLTKVPARGEVRSSNGGNHLSTPTYSLSHVDDYSFSNINLSSPSNSPGSSSPGGGRSPTGAGGNANGNSKGKMASIQKWFGSLAGNSPDGGGGRGYLPPGMTPETNIAPRPRNDAAEWYPSSPKVTFDCFHPADGDAGGRRRGYWNRLSYGQRIAVGVVWAALACVILGVMISEVKKANAYKDGGGASQAVAMPRITAVPTDAPSGEPTFHPTTPPPTGRPVTAAPIAGYHAIHSKANDGTVHPTRSPITSPPSLSPTTKKPTLSPTTNPTTGPTASPSLGCDDVDGEHANHLGNPKTCEWLGSKGGYTDRKDKNCGGRPVPPASDGLGVVVYPTTELGDMCRATCALYNDCPADDADAADAAADDADADDAADDAAPDAVAAVAVESAGGGVMSPMMGNGLVVVPPPREVQPDCVDEEGDYPNHLGHPKDCAWLDNGKPGYTDRKDKNCGGRPAEDPESGGTTIYPTTELGGKCRRTCGPYNGCAAAEAAVSTKREKGAEEVPEKTEIKRHAAHDKLDRCRDRAGLFKNHLGSDKTCEWLYNDKPGPTDRKDKNCGSEGYATTELGRACRETCMIYRPKKEECEAAAGGSTAEDGHLLRSFSSPSSVGDGGGAACADGEGAYEDHKGARKPCAWLTGHGEDRRHGNDDVTRHRQEKNCGSPTGHAITELGRECPWSCKAYNDCGS